MLSTPAGYQVIERAKPVFGFLRRASKGTCESDATVGSRVTVGVMTLRASDKDMAELERHNARE